MPPLLSGAGALSAGAGSHSRRGMYHHHHVVGKPMRSTGAVAATEPRGVDPTGHHPRGRLPRGTRVARIVHLLKVAFM